MSDQAEIEEQHDKPSPLRVTSSGTTISSVGLVQDPNRRRGQGATMVATKQTVKKKPSVFSSFFKSNVRHITGNLGHVDGRSLRMDDSQSGEDRNGNFDWESPRRESLARKPSFNSVNPRMIQSVDAFLVENQSSSVKFAARSLRNSIDGPGANTDMVSPSKATRKEKKVMNKYIGMVPTAPVRDQPVGSKSASSGMNLRFRYKLTNLRRKVISERDGTAKIVRFNESRMAKFGWLRVWQGTVFARPSAPFIWYQSLSLVFLALLSFAVTYLSSKYIYTEISWRDFDRDSLRDIWEVLDEFQVVADCAQVLTTLVSFLLGLYVTKTVDIWWNIRHELLQGVLNTIDSMCSRLAIYFPGNTKEDDEAKEIILRYGVLSVKLLFKDAREVDSWNISDRKRLNCDNLSDLVDEGLLLDHEKELLKDCPSRAQVVWVWIASLFTKWCLDGRLPSPLENQNTILEECNTARNNIAMILARVNTQYPMSYSHLVISMVKVLLIIQALVAGYIFTLSVWTGYYYWACTQVVYLVVWTIFHQAMIDIKEHITNPFRDNPTDFSEMIQSARSINTCRAFFKAGKHPPYAHKSKTNPAALPPQLIVRQIISSRLKKRTHQTGHSPAGVSPGGIRVNPQRHNDPLSPGASSNQLSPPVLDEPGSAATPGRMSTPGATPLRDPFERDFTTTQRNTYL